MVQDQSIDKAVKRRVTRSQLAKEKGKTVTIDESPASKGRLNNLLHTIYIEETPLVQAELLEANKNKTKRVKSSKKLKFDDQVSEFVFKLRRPETMHSRKIQEAQPKASETREVVELHEEPVVPSETSSQLHKDERGKAVITQQEESGFEEVKKKSNLANL